MICSIDGCENVAEKRGWCAMHYRRWHRHGSPYVLKKRPIGSLGVYILDGYFCVQVSGKKFKLHRLIAECIAERPLTEDEIVHHIDGDPLNNHPNNLEITNRSKHTRHHHLGVFDNPKNTATHKWCPQCKTVKPRTEFYKGKEAGNSSARCKKCCAKSSHERTDSIAETRKSRAANPVQMTIKEKRARLSEHRRVTLINNGKQKWCNHCKTTKPVSDFYRDKSAPRGLSGWCKVCNRAVSRLRMSKK